MMMMMIMMMMMMIIIIIILTMIFMEAVRAMPQKYRRKNPVLFDLKLTERRL
jgi:hypothetical protein